MTGLTHRQSEILNIARAFGRVMVEDLAKRFEVSAQTIRKDLNDLCDHRSLTRIHGGAIIASGVENLAYEARRFVAAEEKKAIGAAAAALIPNGCSLFINIGTTTEEVASALTSHEDLLVITNNLNVAMLLYRHPRIEVIVAGGAVRRADGAVIGSTAISLIGQFKVDYAIIGASAIDEEGALLDFDYREVQAAQAIIANARSVMLVADSTKLRRSAPVRIAHISQIQTFVTDTALPAGLANICHTRGIEVIEAMPRSSADIDEPIRARRPSRAALGCPRSLRSGRPAAIAHSARLVPVLRTLRLKSNSRLSRLVPFSVAFVFGCDLLETESEIAKVNWRTPGGASLDRIFDLAIIGGGVNGCGIARDAVGPRQFCFPL